MTLTLYGAAISPFVRKVRVVMAEKGLSYKHEPVNPFKQPAWFGDISPLRRIPVLRDESEGENATLPDSSVICAYLERKHLAPALYPAAPFAYGRALWLEEYADTDFVRTGGGTIFRPVVVKKLMREEPDHATARKGWEEKMPPFLDFLERELGARDHFVGDTLTIADIAVASPFINVAHAGFAPDPARYPNLVRFLKAMHARPSFAACIEEERKLLAPLGLEYAA